MRNTIAVVAALGLLTCLQPLARGAGPNDGNCLSGDIDAKHDLPVCTALIKSGKLHGRALGEAYAARARLYEYTGKYEAALADLNKAMAVDPKNGHHLSRRAYLYVRMVKYGLAMKDFTELGWIAQRAEVYLRLGRFDLAAADYTTVYNEAVANDDNTALATSRLRIASALRDEGARANVAFLDCIQRKASDGGPMTVSLDEGPRLLVDFGKGTILDYDDTNTSNPAPAEISQTKIAASWTDRGFAFRLSVSRSTGAYDMYMKPEDGSESRYSGVCRKAGSQRF